MPLFPVQRDHATGPFFDGTARGEFLLVRDRSTGSVHGPEFDAESDPDRYERFPASGHGVVISWAVVHRKEPDGSTVRMPVGIVQLDEGPWWWTELADADPDDDLMGAEVELDLARIGEDQPEAIPFFRVIRTTAGRSD